MSFRRLYIHIVFVLAALFSFMTAAWAIDDGFEGIKKISGQYFDIYLEPGLESDSLAPQLNVGLGDKMLVGKSTTGQFTSGNELADMIDTLFMQVGDILDMHVYNFRGIIKVCRNHAQLNSIYDMLFQKNINVGSFYVYSYNTIYIDAQSFKREILSHEIAHSVISHYFVVLPPVKIQEILATYVEYQLRKTVS